MFTCNGCGSNDYVGDIKISYGPHDDIGYYSGLNPYITNTYNHTTMETLASYVRFQTLYIPTLTAPSEHLMFAIEVRSRFNYSNSKVVTPNFNFSYPSDIDIDVR